MDIEVNPGSGKEHINASDIFHLNRRSIRNKIGYLNDIAHEFRILCFTETHLDNSIDSTSLKLQSFDSPIRKDQTHNGGGIMIYMSSLSWHNRRKDLETRGLKQFGLR